MEEFVARKRVSIYLVLICWAFAVSMQHPGFAMMVTGTLLLFLLFALRFFAHFEGQYMLKDAEAHQAAGRAHVTVYRHLAFEFGVAVAMFIAISTVLIMIVRHVPWLWFPSTN